MLKSVAVVAVVASALALGVRAQTAAQGLFEADVEIYNDPSILGSVTGHLWYYYAGGAGKLRIDYDVAGSGYSVVKESIDYTAQLRSLYCSSCEASTYKKPMPRFFLVSGDTANPSTLGLPNSVTVGGRSCTGKVKAGVSGEGNVIVVYQDSSDRVCRAIFDDEGIAGAQNIGKYVDFTSTPTTVASNDPAFSEVAGWNCPAPVCAVKIDLFMVMDESGSISSSEFRQEKDFVLSVFQSYTIAPDQVRGGVSCFGYSGRLITGLTGVRNNLLNSISNIVQRGGSTCIPCGIEIAYAHLTGSSRQVGKVCITITDGYNNVRTSELQPKINQMQAAGIISFGIGVGTSLSESQVRALGYNDPNRYFLVSSGFSGLSAILSQLITETCTELPGNPCGSGCRGFCACGQTCLCPTACKSADVCQSGTCVTGANGNGCIFVTNPCDDNNGCTLETCDPLLGCTFPTRTCPPAGTPSNACVTHSCDPTLSTGCVATPIVCTDGNPCTQDLCNTGSGCDFTQPAQCDLCTNANPPLNCPQYSNACFISDCRNNDGFCTSLPISCDDNNACSIDSCDNATGCVNADRVCEDGDLCTQDLCDPVSGCYIAGPVDCDDANNCTIDTCDSAIGCVHTPVNCDDGDICTTDTCNSINGCSSRERDCSVEPEIARFTNDCQLALCSVARAGCFLQQIDGSKVDECGVCNGDNSTCASLETSQIVGIGVGFVVLIVLGAVALCAAIAFIGGKKGYDIYTRNKGGMMGATSSPLYTSGNLQGESQLYDGGA